jgi:hypothetical protein
MHSDVSPHRPPTGRARGNGRGRRLGLSTIATSLVATTLVVLVAPQIASAAAITVTTALDEQTPNGLCSFREAIDNSNDDSGVNADCAAGTGSDVIVFNIPGTGLHTINIATPLPTLTGVVTISGATQPGWTTTQLAIEITGGGVANLLDLYDTTNADVSGLILNGAGVNSAAILAGSGSIIHSNWIGTDSTGNAASAVTNGIGVSVLGQGNVRIGGPSALDRNVISGNVRGILMSGSGGFDASNTNIANNYIGTNKAGTAAVANDTGVALVTDVTGTSITTNVISGNTTQGVLLNGAGVTNTNVFDNIVGLNEAATAAVPNGTGIAFDGGEVGNTFIGNGTAGTGNILSGNDGDGISVRGDVIGLMIKRNFIGTSDDGLTAFGNNRVNGSGGVYIDQFTSTVVVGSAVAGEGNVIAYNNEGVVMNTTDPLAVVNNSVVGNSIFNNVLDGIDIIGADTNDAGDADEGANHRQNFPIISTYESSGDLIVEANIDSTIGASAYPITIDVYRADSQASGEGQTYLGSNTIAAPGQVDIDLGPPGALGLGSGDSFVATATDAAGNTSNFSPPALYNSFPYFLVDSTGDLPDAVIGDGTCDVQTGSANECTLRAAIDEANALPGADSIRFDIPGAGVHTITIGSNLPPIDDELTIDGLTQPGASCVTWPPQLLIEIDASQVVGSSYGLRVNGVPLTLRGVVINHYQTDGVFSIGSSDSVVECNIIGAEPDGSAGISNAQSGAFINGGSNWRIGGPAVGQRNLITGTNIAFQLALAGTDNSVVQNNYIGSDITGTVANGAGSNSALRVSGSGNLVGGIGVNQGNIIAGSYGPGVELFTGTGNSVRANSIKLNLGLGIDLQNVGPAPDFFTEGAGVSFNHAGTAAGGNNYQNYPLVSAATSTPAQTRVVGTLESLPNRTYAIDVYSTPQCDLSGFGSGEVYLGTISTTTDGSGLASFNGTVPSGTNEPNGITTTATDTTDGSTSEFSYCRAASTPNLTWVTAQDIGSGNTQSQYFTDRQQEKWFKIAVQPGDEVEVRLIAQPGSAVSLHRDPNPIYNGLTNPSSAAALSAEAADIGFLPSGSLPSGSLPSGSLPSGSLPSGSLPSGSLPTGFLPSGSLPSGSLPSGSLPSGSLPSGSLPSGSLPSGSLPSGSLPSGSLPSGSLPSGSLPSGSLPSGSLPSGSLPSGSLPSGSLDAYSSAARRSLLGLSADPSAAVQTIVRNTFDLQEDLYVRVVGPYDLSNPFQVSITITGGICSAVTTPPDRLSVIDGAQPGNTGRATVILTDTDRLTGTSAEIIAARNSLAALSSRADVNGVIIDLADARFQRVAFANAQADRLPSCPGAKNIVAREIKAVIDAYRSANVAGGSTSLRYVVLAGGADVIPFFQVQDIAGLANEKEYVPPVLPDSASEAGLRSGLVKGQDFYGSSLDLTVGGNTVALPELAVGRLVDNAADVSAAVAAYIATDGVVAPNSSLITGYDFVGDAATAVQAEIEAGTAASADTLIQPPGQPPTGPDTWSADDLRGQLLGGADHDVVMMSGHFSSGNLLAADYRTNLSASEVAQSDADLTDAIVLALGCHSGFSLPSSDLLGGASPDPDWAKAFLRKGAAGFVAATGYAYGDTELTEYGERLFVGLSQQLRTGSGPIPLGQALVDAKRAYLANTAQVTGIDQKTIVEMTLYGLPMMKVDMPGARLSLPDTAPIVSNPTAVPGATTGLTRTPAVLNTSTTPTTKVLENLQTNNSVTTTYFVGRNGTVANPYEPILPKQIDNVTVPGQVLRGVTFRGGTYSDVQGITPLTTSPTTETSTVHQSFNTEVFYPNQVWMPNYYDAVDGGPTRLFTVPAQLKSAGPGQTNGTVRTFSNVQLALYYLPSNWTSTTSAAGRVVKAAAVSPAPTIQGASAAADSGIVTFRVNAQADGSAGVQSVWIVYTGEQGSAYHGTWAPLDLVRDADDPTLWTGQLDIGDNDPTTMRFLVQAVNGAGLATLSTNLGAYYPVAGVGSPPPAQVTDLAFVQAPTTGGFSNPLTFSARLQVDGEGVAGQTLTFDIAGQQRQAVTDQTGLATVTITPVVTPGSYDVQVSLRGSATFTTATSSRTFRVTPQTTRLSVAPTSATVQSGSPSTITAHLEDGAGRPMGGKSIAFLVTGNGQSVLRTIAADTAGNALLPALVLPAGTYSVRAYFSGDIPFGTPPLTLTDDNYDASQSSIVTLNVTPAPAMSIMVAVRNADGTIYVPGAWTEQNVVVDFTCTAGLVAITSCEPDRSLTAEGITAASIGTVKASNGEAATVAVPAIQIDRTIPTIAINTPAVGATFTAGTAVPAAFECTDATSGVSTCTGTVAAGAPIDTATVGPKSFTVDASDAAGNTASATVQYSVVAAPVPTITVALTNADGTTYVPGTWTKQNVTVTFTCASTVGIASCEPNRTISAEGSTPSSIGTATGNNNQQATVSVPAIQIDTTAPVVSVTTPASGASYTVGSAVVAAYTCSDAAAGVVTCAGPVAVGAPIDTAAVGPHSFVVGTSDAAGNTASPSVSYSVVAAPVPTITVALTNADGTTYVPGNWTTQNVIVTFTCASTTGVSSCEPNRTITAEGITGASTGTVTAAGGQQATVPVPAIQIDRTPPTVTVTAPASAVTYAVGASVAAAYTCADAASSVVSCVGPVAVGAPIDTATAGSKSFVVTATDAAGNLFIRTVAYTVGAANAAPVVRADMGVAGLQDIGYTSRTVVLSGSFTDADGAGPYRASIRWTPTGPFSPFVLNNNSNFLASYRYPSAGARVVTVRVCDRAGACGTDDVTLRVDVSRQLVLVRPCVVDRGPRTNPRYQARFGYVNPAPFAIFVSALGGDNTVKPNPVYRGQPQIFLPGARSSVFSANFNSGTVSWKLDGTTVRATSTSPRC